MHRRNVRPLVALMLDEKIKPKVILSDSAEKALFANLQETFDKGLNQVNLKQHDYNSSNKKVCLECEFHHAIPVSALFHNIDNAVKFESS